MDRANPSRGLFERRSSNSRESRKQRSSHSHAHAQAGPARTATSLEVTSRINRRKCQSASDTRNGAKSRRTDDCATNSFDDYHRPSRRPNIEGVIRVPCSRVAGASRRVNAWARLTCTGAGALSTDVVTPSRARRMRALAGTWRMERLTAPESCGVRLIDGVVVSIGIGLPGLVH
jgi:hypothetical protein